MALVGFQWHLRSEIALVLTHTLPTSGLIAEIKLNSLNTEFFFYKGHYQNCQGDSSSVVCSELTV